jgi:hypothetical protein
MRQPPNPPRMHDPVVPPTAADIPTLPANAAAAPPTTPTHSPAADGPMAALGRDLGLETGPHMAVAGRMVDLMVDPNNAATRGIEVGNANASANAVAVVDLMHSTGVEIRSVDPTDREMPTT